MSSSSLYPDLPIVIVDDDVTVLKAIGRTLGLNGFNNIVAKGDSRHLMSFLEEKDVSMVLLDITMPHIRGDALLEEIVARHPHLPVVMATATDDINTVVDCMKKGAFDYITKPISTGRLLSAIYSALEVADLRLERDALRQKDLDPSLVCPECFGKIITANREMLKIFSYVEKIATSSRPVLITGETGVGKELIAEAIHLASGRKGKFVVVNVAALDDAVFSDALFGHVKGAYTDASTARGGLVKKAAGGTLLLDEMGSLSLASQVKLLRLIQEREYQPLGADVPMQTDVSIIASTNSNLEEKVRQGKFRGDLYFRLRTHSIHLPPLRDRLDDLPLLVSYFTTQAARESGLKPPKVPGELFPLLKNYSFPGNVRELKSMIDDTVLSQKSRQMSLAPFYKLITPNNTAKPLGEPSGRQASVLFGETLPSAQEVRILLAEEALLRSGGNISMAAHLIGITRQSLSQFVRRNKITIPNNNNKVG